jgi:hypothetical protein
MLVATMSMKTHLVETCADQCSPGHQDPIAEGQESRRILHNEKCLFSATPGSGLVQSLNVAATAAILLYASTRQEISGYRGWSTHGNSLLSMAAVLRPEPTSGATRDSKSQQQVYRLEDFHRY